MTSQTIPEIQAESSRDLANIVDDMGIWETKLIRLSYVPKGMAPNCELLTFHLSNLSEGRYRIAIIQPDMIMMPDYIQIIKNPL